MRDVGQRISQCFLNPTLAINNNPPKRAASCCFCQSPPLYVLQSSPLVGSRVEHHNLFPVAVAASWLLHTNSGSSRPKQREGPSKYLPLSAHMKSKSGSNSQSIVSNPESLPSKHTLKTHPLLSAKLVASSLPQTGGTLHQNSSGKHRNISAETRPTGYTKLQVHHMFAQSSPTPHTTCKTLINTGSGVSPSASTPRPHALQRLRK